MNSIFCDRKSLTNQALFAQGMSLQLEQGDVVLFHSGLFHAAGRNDSDTVKASVVFAYHGEKQSRPARHALGGIGRYFPRLSSANIIY